MKRNVNFSMKIVSTISIVLLLATLLVLGSMPAFAATTGTTTSTIKFNPGELQLVLVPGFNFGEQDVVSATTVYPAESVTDKITVTDARGSASGWNLSVSLSEFTNGGSPSLASAELTLPVSTVAPVGGTLSSAPVASSITMISNAAPQNVLVAVADSGEGTWDGTFSAPATTLKIFAGTARTGTNTATLSWSLTDTP